MPVFIHGQDIEYDFGTSAGLVGVLAEVHVSGSTLELRDAVVYPRYGDRLAVGLQELLEIARMIEELARLEGFEVLIVTGKRLSGASRGRPVLLRRRIR